MNQNSISNIHNKPKREYYIYMMLSKRTLKMYHFIFLEYNKYFLSNTIELIIFVRLLNFLSQNLMQCVLKRYFKNNFDI